MPTVPTFSPVLEVSAELVSLRQNGSVEAVYFKWLDDTYVVWIGICNDDSSARRAAYQLEDSVSEKFPSVLFDFHVVALPEGKKIQDYVSNAQVVFQRGA